jgi:hypothetical protein
MSIVGAFARIETTEVRARLDALDGVDTFDLADPEKVGLLIEADGLDAAHELLTKRIVAVEGVLGVFPIYVNDEEIAEPAQAGSIGDESHGTLTT